MTVSFSRMVFLEGSPGNFQSLSTLLSLILTQESRSMKLECP